ncbi:MAG: type I glyceraldehyde-3-phosphate dehydrogenase [Candidatus Kaiserbacteria bacterium]|nr:type I glyceraldehyde-3-phosphate dehydrogenase [Candidatus Kaiserbacteria bacterium]
MKRVAINGFGRIGRAFFRLAFACKDVAVVAVNDLMALETGAYLLQYDTVRGRFVPEVVAGEDVLRVGRKEVSWLSVKNPTELPWRSLEVDVVIEATGVFTSYEKAYMHIIAGAKHALITAPVKGDPPENVQAGTVLFGVNEGVAREYVVSSNASCTTNAVGIPLALLDEAVGVESALLNTVHSYTATQQTVDGPSRKDDLRFGRAAGMNIIPSSTGAAVATTKVLSSLRGKFDGIALRVPTITGSLADLTFIAKQKTTVQEVNEVLERGRSTLFTTTTDPVVSSDIIGEPFVSVADLSMTRVVNGNLVKVLLWYDNETGYAQSLLERVMAI